MAAAEIFTIFFTPLVQPLSYFIVILIGTMLGGVFVTQGNGWGKIAGSNKFQPKNRVLIFYVLWAIGITISIDYFAPLLQTNFSKHIVYFPAIILQFSIIFYLWFNHDFRYRQNWIKFGIMELIVVGLGYLIVSGA